MTNGAFNGTALNAHRGETAVRLGGETIVLRPTFECLAEIESALGEGLLATARRVAHSGLGFRDAAALIAAGSKAAGRSLDPRWLRQALLDAGLVGLSAPLCAFLVGAVTGAAPGDAQPAPAAEGDAARPIPGAGSVN